MGYTLRSVHCIVTVHALMLCSCACAQALDAGLVHDGLVTFTGGASDEIDLGTASPGLLWNKIVHFHVPACACHIVACSTHAHTHVEYLCPAW